MTVKQNKRVFFFWNGFQFNITGAITHLMSSDRYFQKYKLISIATPLFKFEPNEIRIEFLNSLKRANVLKRRYYPRPPISYLLDIFLPLFMIRSLIIVSFSPHVTYFALILKRFGLIKHIVHWSIDFSPRRFRNPIVESIYRLFDKKSFLKSDLHVDVSAPANLARIQLYGERSSHKKRGNLIIPVGIPESALEQISAKNFSHKRIFFLGNLTSTVGIDSFVKVCERIGKQDLKATFHVIGSGPEYENSKSLAIQLGIGNRFTWYGNLIKDEFESLLKTASIGLAPYKNLPDSFSIYADPSKIKNYAQFGIPFVMTNVPKVSSEFRSHKIGVVVDDDLDDLSAAALNLLELESLWIEQSDSIFKYAKSITWSTVLEDFIEELRRL